MEKMSKTMIPAVQKKLKNIKLLVMDFDGVITDNMVWTSEEGREYVVSNRSDGHGISQMRTLRPDIRMMVISKETNIVVKRRCEKLKLECHTGIINKSTLLNSLVKEMGITMEEVAYIGNDINDTGCVSAAGIGIAVADAYEEVKDAAYIITHNRGGHGAVREIIDAILEEEK